MIRAIFILLILCAPGTCSEAIGGATTKKASKPLGTGLGAVVLRQALASRSVFPPNQEPLQGAERLVADPGHNGHSYAAENFPSLHGISPAPARAAVSKGHSASGNIMDPAVQNMAADSESFNWPRMVDRSMLATSGTAAGRRSGLKGDRQPAQLCEDINAATAATLQSVQGIGLAKARAIIEFRDQNGPFESLDELARVRGIGPATVENFREAGFCVRAVDREDIQAAPPLHAPGSTPRMRRPDCVDINVASASELQQVSDIGPAKARAVIEYRGQRGPFGSLDELARVRGVGPATVENFRAAGFCIQDAANESSDSTIQPSVSGNVSSAREKRCEDLNTASIADLQRVKGIGRAKAHAIIEHREARGAFGSLDALLNVRGIGPATLQNFRQSGFCVNNPEFDEE